MVKRAAACLLLVAGCGQAAFDDRAERAWSHSAGAPDGVSSGSWAVALTTVDREQPGATVVVAGAGPSSLATLSFDVGGELEMHGVDIEGELPAAPVMAGSLDPVTGGNGALAVADGAGNIQFYDARTGDLGPAFRVALPAQACGAPASLGNALVFALTDPEEDVEPDLVALADDQLVVVRDVDLDHIAEVTDCAHCALADGPAVALATGAIDDDDGEDIAALAASGTRIAVYTADQVRAAAGADCGTALVALQPPGSGASFAAPMAFGDIEDNDAPEVAVASPDHRVVYVFHDVSAGGGAPVLIQIPAPADSSAFGTSIAFGDFDGDEVEELAIGDPDASPEGVTGAGQVTLYRYDGDELRPEATLYDSEPEEGQHFGRSLDVAEFGLGGAEYRDLLVVGASDEVFTYFRVTATGDDPRG